MNGESPQVAADTGNKPMTDAINEYYKQFVDREALRENLKRTPEERLFKTLAIF